MARLRAEDGCPWDAEQTPETLTPYILEEACELIDAIEAGDVGLIMDELGDLLLQVVFQAQIFQERNQFGFAEIARTITAKLIRRHPHVFAPTDQDLSPQELDQQWQSIKQAEQAELGISHAPMKQVPATLPALQRTQKVLSRARQAGLHRQLPTADDTEPLREILTRADQPLDAETLGAALMQLVVMADAAELDAEAVLRQTLRQFVTRLTEPDEGS